MPSFKPTPLGERIARRLIEEHRVRLVFDPNQHSVQRDYGASHENRRGDDCWVWWLADQFGHAHVIETLPDGSEWRHPAQIGSMQPASELVNRRKCPVWYVEGDGHLFLILGGKPDSPAPQTDYWSCDDSPLPRPESPSRSHARHP